MIERYRNQLMTELFDDKRKFKAFLDVEIASLKAFAKLELIPKEAVEAVINHARIDVDRIIELEQVTKHDVIAFTRAVGETLGDEKKWFHYGLTSTDVVDTAMSTIYKEANGLIDARLDAFMDVLKRLANTYRKTPCIGRTHGIHADVTAFGLKFALYYEDFKRHRRRFDAARKVIEVGKISGAVGNFAHTPPFIQDEVCQLLGLSSANISTQTLQRDRHAEYMNSLTLIASGIEKIALEVRHLMRTEVGEVSEYFSKGQKGSSAMPHKKNPIASENMCGCSRMMRGYLSTVHENIALWHERDISHSSVERVVIPDALQLLDYMLGRYTKVLDTLVVYPKRMENNIYITHGVIFSQRVLNALIHAGLSREEAYDLVQPIAFKAYEEAVDFKGLLLDNEAIMRKLNTEDVERCFTLDYYLREVDTIFTRVFGEDAS